MITITVKITEGVGQMDYSAKAEPFNPTEAEIAESERFLEFYRDWQDAQGGEEKHTRN